MANINDYLIWRGDIKISDDYKFNEVDSMILARFSYLRFDMIKVQDIDTIENISNNMKDFANDVFLYNGDKELITALGVSPRFNKMQVTDFEQNSDKETEKQFGAITIHLSTKEMYVSFIGTDCTINGWKEDFNMAFMHNVPCQIDGKNYLEKIAKKYPEKMIRIGGHSKGGNVAIYAALSASEDVKKRIIKVDNFDGPGFNKDIVEEYAKSKILDKIETYIPQDSIIGRILNHKEKTTVVLSLEKGIYQHDIYSWQVLKNEAIKLEKNTDMSEDVNKTITNWLETTDVYQRKIFIDSLFELLFSTDANTFSDISKNLSIAIPKILQKYKQIPEENKKTATNMFKLFISSYLNVLREKQSSKIEKIKEQYKKK